MGTERQKPFLRWPGGKRVFAPRIQEFFPEEYSRYVEPFLGGGAVFFHSRAKRALLSDLNKELINTYVVVRDQVDDLILWLREQTASKENYYAIRSSRPTSDLERAGRFVYLNRTAFNGIWRVNRKGEFNVPYGHRPRRDLVEAESLKGASVCLQAAELVAAPYSDVVTRAGSGDLVYLDPPYTVRHDLNGFRKYNEVLFSWEDQVRLAELAHEAVNGGATVLVSNAHTDEIRALYDGFEEIELVRSSSVAASSDFRGRITESLFVRRSDYHL